MAWYVDKHVCLPLLANAYMPMKILVHPGFNNPLKSLGKSAGRLFSCCRVTWPRTEECFTQVWVGLHLLGRVLSTVSRYSSVKPSIFPGSNFCCPGRSDLWPWGAGEHSCPEELVLLCWAALLWLFGLSVEQVCATLTELDRTQISLSPGSCDPQISLNSPADSPLDLSHFTLACQSPL